MNEKWVLLVVDSCCCCFWTVTQLFLRDVNVNRKHRLGKPHGLVDGRRNNNDILNMCAKSTS
ncbi:hypothetical protein MTR_4g008560 [Medicago truncatula]|uniref:Uncharacterized protein n=1 Tax=Medicago truncatula TaxID=3880 RepID=A0A072UGS3_MEDTR|nr:hypothetical protein MTR_4g008560 [Medicago truncatula]